MEKEKLIRQEVITLGGHFYPLVFVDISVPTATIGVACTYAGRSINEKINDRDKKICPNLSTINGDLVSLSLTKKQENVWIQSISDICL